MLYCGTLSVWFEFRYYTVRSRPTFVLHDHVFLGVLTHQDASYCLSWACFIFLILGMCRTPVLTDLSMRSGMYYFLCNISYVVLNGSWLNWWICEYDLFFYMPLNVINVYVFTTVIHDKGNVNYFMRLLLTLSYILMLQVSPYKKI